MLLQFIILQPQLHIFRPQDLYFRSKVLELVVLDDEIFNRSTGVMQFQLLLTVVFCLKLRIVLGKLGELVHELLLEQAY